MPKTLEPQTKQPPVRHESQDPRQAHDTPPFPEQKQQPPGSEAEMMPKADHGEKSYTGLGRLKGKSAIITGADSGIGRAIAIAFAREGADVLISYLNEHEDAKETERWVRDAGKKAVVVPGDIGQKQHCRDLVDRAVKEFGKLDILINNAGFQKTHNSLDEVSEEELEHTFRTNIFAMFFLCQAALPRMEKGGAIVNTASIQAYQPSAELLPYASTKGAIVTFTKGLASMAAKQGIRVNAVAPGPIWTPLIPSTMPEEKVKQFGKNTPLGRAGQPVEVAPMYVFLSSNESTYITGDVFGVAGGRVLA
jgi:NAD(P)-dependent dehydrogenase (short-subunit alcohol dehydrogenase family)